MVDNGFLLARILHRPLPPPGRLRDHGLVEGEEPHVPDVHQHPQDHQLHYDVVPLVGVVANLPANDSMLFRITSMAS